MFLLDLMLYPYWWLKMKNHFDAKNQIVWFKGGGGMGDLQLATSIHNYESIMLRYKWQA
jgi:exopolysaccharide biosynthesis predicted pyruvyltransferase EpsI